MVSTVTVTSTEPKQTGSSTLAGANTAHRISTVHVVVSGSHVPMLNCHPIIIDHCHSHEIGGLQLTSYISLYVPLLISSGVLVLLAADPVTAEAHKQSHRECQSCDGYYSPNDDSYDSLRRNLVPSRNLQYNNTVQCFS